MSLAERILSIAKQIITVNDTVNQMHSNVARMRDDITDIKHRLIRIETLVEFSQYKRLPKRGTSSTQD